MWWPCEGGSNQRRRLGWCRALTGAWSRRQTNPFNETSRMGDIWNQHIQSGAGTEQARAPDRVPKEGLSPPLPLASPQLVQWWWANQSEVASSLASFKKLLVKAYRSQSRDKRIAVVPSESMMTSSRWERPSKWESTRLQRCEAVASKLLLHTELQTSALFQRRNETATATDITWTQVKKKLKSVRLYTKCAVHLIAFPGISKEKNDKTPHIPQLAGWGRCRMPAWRTESVATAGSRWRWIWKSQRPPAETEDACLSHRNYHRPHTSHLVPSTAASSRDERPSSRHRSQARQWHHWKDDSFLFDLLLLCITSWSRPSRMTMISRSSGSVMLLATSVGPTALPCVFLSITSGFKDSGMIVCF